MFGPALLSWVPSNEPNPRETDVRATVMHGAGDVRIENVPDPTLVEPTDAILRVTRACICGSDLWPYASMEPSDTGRSMGHEAVGIVEDVGAEVRTLKRGDLVVMPFAISDGTCEFCHEGLQTECVHVAFFGNNGMNARRPRPFGSPTRTARSTSSRSLRTTR
jgi:threonine dehydrogenase-like Zn-dependent dehydrogenase